MERRRKRSTEFEAIEKVQENKKEGLVQTVMFSVHHKHWFFN